MPAKIRVLSESTINQIAAGEIIEDPASLIKELIENSVDAGSSKVNVHVHGGGHLSIEVSDDGSGMAKDDAILCLERHATSKISEFNDLNTLVSMGFRGEALASIGAVSKMEIETAEYGVIGTKVTCHGGKILKVEPVSRNQGTTIKVISLFYNVPARKKFQKPASQSLAEIKKMLTRVALAHPAVSLTLTSHEKDLLTTTAKKEKRIEEVLGKGFLEQTKPIQFEREGYKISGIIGTPSNTRSNRLAQYLLINKRPVVSSHVERAIQSAFGTRIGTKEYPLFVLWMEVPPERLDVNVHPQKIFVRFCQEEKIEHFIKQAIESAFFEAPRPVVYPKFENQRPVIPVTQPPSLLFLEPKQEYQPALIEEEMEVVGFYDDIAFVKLPSTLPWYPEESLVVVDIPKLDAKIQFHKMTTRLGDAEMEQLLFPEIIKVTKAEEEIIEKHQPLLQKIGIAIRPFGKETFAIDALSPLFSPSQLRKILDLLFVEFRKEFTLEGVCKLLLNFRPPKIYNSAELRHLLKELFKLPDPFYAPNGKLILKKFNKEEMFDKK